MNNKFPMKHKRRMVRKRAANSFRINYRIHNKVSDKSSQGQGHFRRQEAGLVLRQDLLWLVFEQWNNKRKSGCEIMYKNGAMMRGGMDGGPVHRVIESALGRVRGALTDWRVNEMSLSRGRNILLLFIIITSLHPLGLLLSVIWWCSELERVKDVYCICFM